MGKDLEMLRELSLAEQLGRLHRLWRTVADLELAPLGLTHPRWTALWKLSRLGGQLRQKNPDGGGGDRAVRGGIFLGQGAGRLFALSATIKPPIKITSWHNLLPPSFVEPATCSPPFFALML